METSTLLIGNLWDLRDRDVARLGDVALYLDKRAMLPALITNSSFSPRTDSTPENIAWSYYAPPVMFFVRRACWPLERVYCHGALPDVYFDSDRDLPSLTLRVPPGYAAFVREQSWDTIRRFCRASDRGPLTLFTWWTNPERAGGLSQSGTGHKEVTEPSSQTRGRSVDAELIASKETAKRLDRETAAKLFAIWMVSVLPDDFFKADDYASIAQEKQALDTLDRYAGLVDLEVRAMSPPKELPPKKLPSPFDATIRVSLRWLTAVLVELFIRLAHPHRPLRKLTPLEREYAPKIVAATDMATDIMQRFRRRDIARLRPTKLEVELLQDLFGAIVRTTS